jgi:hypothetical protein
MFFLHTSKTPDNFKIALLGDHILYSELLEKISEAEAERLIALHHKREKIAA